jgi:hypothetical protein
MLNLLTTLCLLEAGLVLTLVGSVLQWRRDDKRRNDGR